MELERISYEKRNSELWSELKKKAAMAENAERDLEIEREWRSSLESSKEEERDKIFHLNQELKTLRETAKVRARWRRLLYRRSAFINTAEILI